VSPMLKRAAMIALIALGLVPVQASASDVSATHAYIQANYALNRGQVSLIHPGEAKIQAYNHRIATECPRAGAGAPQTDAAYPMSYEVAVALWSLAYGTAAAPIRKFVNAVKPLRWSNARLTRIAHGYATSLHELSTLPLPDLCGDVRAWAASRFQAIPASTTVNRSTSAARPSCHETTAISASEATLTPSSTAPACSSAIWPSSRCPPRRCWSTSSARATPSPGRSTSPARSRRIRPIS